MMMMMIQYKVISLLFVANIAMGNLGELNSIFSTYTHPRESSTCNSIGEPFQRHTVINNIEKAMEIGLNKSFHEKYICLQKVFDEKLIEMQQAYKKNADETTPTAAADASTTTTNSGDKSSKHQSSSSKLHKYHGHLADHFIGQTGFIFYSIDQNGTITDFKHESFKFVKPVANLSDASLLESELDAFNSDLFALKALSTNIKKNIRLRMNLLKAIETNEKELELEQKEQEKLLSKAQQESEADKLTVSSKKEKKKLKKLQKQKPQADAEEAKKEEKSKEKRNAEEKSGSEEKTAVNASEQSVNSSSNQDSSSSVQDKKPEVDVVQSGEKKVKRDQSASKNKTKKVKKSKSKSGKRDKSVKQNTKSSSSTNTKPVQKV